MRTDTYSVGRLAKLANISVRTLHHYDELGLVRPSQRSESGYRLYGAPEVERLQQVLFYRELGLSLDSIADLLADPRADASHHLRRQHRQIKSRIDQLQHLLVAIERAMEADKMNIALSPEERLEVFGEFDPDRYSDEAKERWGDTDAFKESTRKAGQYSKDDWLELQAEMSDIVAGLVAALAAGVAPDSDQAMDLAERHRRHITRWFYDCSTEIHLGLATMYVEDARFTAHYEGIAEGLAEYLRDAIVANARRA